VDQTRSPELWAAARSLLERSELSRHATSVVLSRNGERMAWQSGELPGVGTVDEHTVMYVASVTKQLVAALAAMAVHEGVMGYHEPVTSYLASLPGWLDRVRVHHLLHHTSGLPELTEPWTDDLDNLGVLDRLRWCPGPDAPAGTRFSYNNAGYVLLAAAVEAALQQPIQVLASSRVFAPLGMTDSRLGGLAPVRLEGRPAVPRTVGDGGWWTSAAGLHRWLVALNRGRLGAALTRTLETPGRLDDDTPLDYAWGMRVSQVGGRRTLTHGGSWPGWLTKTVRQPELGIAVCVLSTAPDETLVSETALLLAGLA
jgi:CubicO group peptidase (beta-lactamase class C family)